MRQGCPHSPILFALYLEPLCLSILKNLSIHGYTIGFTEVKLLAYADDVAFFCSHKKSVEEALRVTQGFCELTGVLINKDKSSGLWLGMWGSTPSEFPGIRWNEPSIKYLGVPLDQARNSGPY